jgi:ABC-type transport system involved in multi-copper enzyme maturation permease subunit
MTAQTMPAQPAEDTGLRPLPWRRMTGVIWRQHRFALITVAAVLGAAAVYVWIVGSTLHSAYGTALACRPVGSPACQNAVNTFNGLDNFLSNGIIVQVFPVLIGTFVGAPLLARELETGTFRYTWTQGFGRWRWTLAKLLALGLAVTVAAELFSLVLGWYYQPYFAAGNYSLTLNELSPFNSGLFDLNRVAFAAWTLAAFSIGALAGMLIRRVVPAILATLAVYAGLAFATGGFLREHYLTPLLSTSLTVPHSAWILGQWWTRGGVTLSQAAMVNIMDPIFYRLIPPPARADDAHLYKQQAYTEVVQYLTRHGYTYWTQYQPGNRFWPFQWIEGGWLLVLSALLIAATVWLVRRRAA